MSSNSLIHGHSWSKSLHQIAIESVTSEQWQMRRESQDVPGWNGIGNRNLTIFSHLSNHVGYFRSAGRLGAQQGGEQRENTHLLDLHTGLSVWKNKNHINHMKFSRNTKSPHIISITVAVMSFMSVIADKNKCDINMVRYGHFHLIWLKIGHKIKIVLTQESGLCSSTMVYYMSLPTLDLKALGPE